MTYLTIGEYAVFDRGAVAKNDFQVGDGTATHCSRESNLSKRQSNLLLPYGVSCGFTPWLQA